MTNYSVDATYRAFAIGIVPSEVTQWQIKTKDQTMQDVDCISGVDLDWIFVTGQYSSSTPVVMTVKGTSGPAEGFNFVTDTPDDNQKQVAFGRWYIIHPASAFIQTGVFGLNLPTWQEGE